MTDTLTVTATIPNGSSFNFQFEGMGNYYAAGSSTWDDPAMADAAHLYNAIQSMEDGSFTKALFADWLQFNAKGRENIPMINARFATMETMRFNEPGKAYFQFAQYNEYEGHTPGNNFTSGAFAPFLGLWHYISGNGVETSLDITTIGLTFNQSNLTPVNDALKSQPPGNYPISSNFGKSVAEDNLYVAALLGRISMKTEGTLSIGESGEWSYNGVVRAYNDTYDANFDPSRGVIAQASTTVLSWFNGKPYPIALPGEIPVQLSGHR